MWRRDTNTYFRASIRKLQVTQRKMEKSMLGLRFRERVRNEDIHRRTQVNDMVKHILRTKWKWAGHIARMSGNR